MAKEKVYLETSVISYLAARPSRDVVKLAKQDLTRRWWEEHRRVYEFYVSDTVLEEIQFGDPDAARRRRDVVAGLPVLKATASIIEFHERLFTESILPLRAKIDALHIAVAAAHGMAYLATWNCRHINNATLRGKFLDEIRRAGYNEIVIATPEELRRFTQ